MMQVSAQETARRIVEGSRGGRSLTVCVGPGVSMSAGIPSWSDISQQLLSLFAHREVSDRDLSEFLKGSSSQQVLEFLSRRLGTTPVVEGIKRIIEGKDVAPSELHRALASVPANAFITTNYDTLLEASLSAIGKLPKVVLSDADTYIAETTAPRIIKLHGSLDRPASIVLSESDVAGPLGHGELVNSYVRALMASSIVIFVGFSLQSPDLQNLYEEYRPSTADMIDWVILSVEPNTLLRELWVSRGVRIAEIKNFAEMPQFLSALGNELLTVRQAPAKTQSERRVFIAASSEDHDMIERLKHTVHELGWQSVVAFEAPGEGRTISEKISYLIDTSTGAIVVVPSRSHMRGQRYDMARSNVLFELGYLCGRLGHNRVLLIAPKEIRAFPADIAGIQFLISDPDAPEMIATPVMRWLGDLVHT